LDKSERAKRRSPAWQKCLILEQPQVHDFDQVIWIDCDIVINEGAPAISGNVQLNEFGIVEAYSNPDPATASRRLKRLYSAWRRRGVQINENLTAERFYTNRGLPPHDKLGQTGVFVCSPAFHSPVLRRTYYDYEDEHGAEWNYEMGPLSHEVISGTRVLWLDGRFNQEVLMAMQDRMPTFIEMAIDEFPPILRRIGGSVYRRTMHEHLIRKAVREIHARSWFTHFAAARQWMRYLG
jgi:hypothetical protein